MYIKSVAITFSSQDDLCTTCISLDPVVGCTLLHAMNFIYKNPIVNSYLRNKYYIVGLNFKYSEL